MDHSDPTPALPLLHDVPQSHPLREVTRTRIPHLGHTALFIGLVVLFLFVAEAILFALPGHTRNLQDIRLQTIGQIVDYLLAFFAAWLVYPWLWKVSFLDGISWRANAARWWLVPLGLALGFVAQAVESHLPIHKPLPMQDLFHDAQLLPILGVLAVLVAPLMEEIIFRGFLLPALASGYDYLRLPKFELPAAALATHERWRLAPASRPALLFSTIVTSALFALIHAVQLGFNWAAISLLGFVSVALCLVRLRLRSVAASTLVHASYNFSVFLSLAVVTGGFRHLEKLR